MDALERIPKTPYGQPVYVGPAQTVTAGDFGNRSILGDIQGVVFVDTDGDGLQDSGEPGHAGVTVYLDQDNNGQFDVGELSAVTDQDGVYRFAELRAAGYVVRGNRPGGLSADVRRSGRRHVLWRGQPRRSDATGPNRRRNGPGHLGRNADATYMHGIVITHDGRLYGIHGPNNSLYSIDPATGQMALHRPQWIHHHLGWPTTGRPTRSTASAGPAPATRLTGCWCLTGPRARHGGGPGSLGLTATSGLTYDAFHGRLIAFDNVDDGTTLSTATETPRGSRWLRPRSTPGVWPGTDPASCRASRTGS